jgi:hypothetical protein
VALIEAGEKTQRQLADDRREAEIRLSGLRRLQAAASQDTQVAQTVRDVRLAGARVDELDRLKKEVEARTAELKRQAQLDTPLGRLAIAGDLVPVAWAALFAGYLSFCLYRRLIDLGQLVPSPTSASDQSART